MRGFVAETGLSQDIQAMAGRGGLSSLRPREKQVAGGLSAYSGRVRSRLYRCGIDGNLSP